MYNWFLAINVILTVFNLQYKSLDRFGSIDSEDTFLSCNTHPFPSQVKKKLNLAEIRQIRIGKTA